MSTTCPPTMPSVPAASAISATTSAMTRESPATIVVVVHRGKVVVDQRVGVDELERARRGQDALGHAAHGLAAGDDEDGPQALAAGHHAVAHGPVDGGRGRGLRRQHAVERLVDEPAALVDIRLEVE